MPFTKCILCATQNANTCAIYILLIYTYLIPTCDSEVSLYFFVLQKLVPKVPQLTFKRSPLDFETSAPIYFLYGPPLSKQRYPDSKKLSSPSSLK